MQRSLRYGHPLALLMADIDHFKQVNDLHGHQAGNAVLQYVGRTMRAEVRITDIVARYGGEEFAVILPETETSEVYGRRRASARHIAANENTTVPAITISIGVSAYQGDDFDGARLIESADPSPCTTQSRRAQSRSRTGRRAEPPGGPARYTHNAIEYEKETATAGWQGAVTQHNPSGYAVSPFAWEGRYGGLCTPHRPALGILFSLTLGALALALFTAGPGARSASPPHSLAAPAVPTDTPPAACGLAWRRVPSPNMPGNSNALLEVAALARDDIWAAGDYQTPDAHVNTLIEHWDGSAWTVVPSPNAGRVNYLYGVTAISADDIWAVGQFASEGTGARALLLHWDGSAWSLVPAPQASGFTGLRAVDAVSASDIWAVGYVTMHWDGSAWTIVPDAGFGGLEGVVALSPADVWAVGAYYNGSAQRDPGGTLGWQRLDPRAESQRRAGVRQHPAGGDGACLRRRLGGGQIHRRPERSLCAADRALGRQRLEPGAEPATGQQRTARGRRPHRRRCVGRRQLRNGAGHLSLRRRALGRQRLDSSPRRQPPGLQLPGRCPAARAG